MLSLARRRDLLLPLIAGAAFGKPAPITSCDQIAVRATARTVWLFVRLRTADGIEGWGEASDAFGFANTTRQEALRMESELRSFAGVAGKGKGDLAAYIKAGRSAALAGGRVAATAYSAIEQALWDIAGRRRGMPLHRLLPGGTAAAPKRSGAIKLAAYANINRATSPRNPEGFADSARRAAKDGFRAMKLAPFDGFPARTAPATDLTRAIESGIASVLAVRAAVGESVEVMVDLHSFFTVPESIEIARRLEPARLGWYEEPVPPEKTEETVAIRRAIRQRMAGGEFLFGVEGFRPLTANQAVHVIMPDVKHCGGFRELLEIARMAGREKIEVSPHNPSGPVATLGTLHTAAVLPNVRLVEFQYGEVDWRASILDPPEGLERGEFTVPDGPGLGAKVNEAVARRHAL